MKIDQTHKLSELLIKLNEIELSNKIRYIEIKIAAKTMKDFPNLFKWKILNRDLKREFKKMREVLAQDLTFPAFTQPTSKSGNQDVVKAVGLLKNWIEYVDEIQGDHFGEQTYGSAVSGSTIPSLQTEYTDELIAESLTWPDVFKIIRTPNVEKMAGSNISTISGIINNIVSVVPAARQELKALLK